MRRSIAFVIVFWGEKYRDFFLDYCLASMLAPNNLAAFNRSSNEPGAEPIDVRLILCSTPQDFEAVSRTALFRRLTAVAGVEFIDIGLPGPNGNVMHHMSLGHKLALRAILDTRSYGAFLGPDTVLPDGALRTLARHMRNGVRTVLAPAFRFDFASAVGQLQQAGVMTRDQPLVIAPRALAKIAVTSLHSELKRFAYDEDHFCDQPMEAIFRSPGVGLVVHDAYWAIAAADFANRPGLDGSVLDDETIDARFISMHLMSPEPVLLDDSDDYLMLSVTAEEDFPHAHLLVPDPYLAGRPEPVKDARKTAFLRTWLFSKDSDAFKRWAFRRPVRLHHADLPVPDTVAARSVALVERALAVAPPVRPIYFFVGCRTNDLRATFAESLMAALMAPQNFPTLAGTGPHRLFIACSDTNRTWLLDTCWMLRCARSFVEVEFIEIGEPGPAEIDALLHAARQSVAARCVADQAYLSILEPDLLISDGAIARIAALARSGHEAVLALPFPVDAARFNARLTASRHMIWERALPLPPRALARNALAFPAAGDALQQWHPAPGGFVIQGTAWTVLLADLGAVGVRADGPLPDDVLDRALAALQARGRIHHVTDSDDIAVVRLMTPASPRPRSAPTESDSAALVRLATALDETRVTPTARALLQIPVRWHGTDLGPLWDVIAARARALAEAAVRHADTLTGAALPIDKAAAATRHDHARARALHDHRDGDATIEAFVAAGHADALVAQLARRDAPTPTRPLPAGRRRLRRYLAGAAGTAVVERLLRAGRLDATVERLAASGAVTRAWGRGIGPTALRWFHALLRRR